jgi:hypothetical protein
MPLNIRPRFARWGVNELEEAVDQAFMRFHRIHTVMQKNLTVETE